MKKLTLFLLLISNIGICQNTSNDKQRQISEYVQNFKDDYNLPGVVVAITNGNEIEYFESFGNVSKEDNFIIGSNSKAFTALIILKLQEQGLLNINDPVVKYLDWFQYQNKQLSNKITLKDLLHHSSGLSTEMGMDFFKSDVENVKTKITEKLRSVELDTYPITDFVYSNTNYQLLGYVIEKVTDQDYSSVLKSEITTPLKMNNTSTFLSKDIVQGYQYFLYYPIIPVTVNYNKVDIPAGYINSNVNDLSKYLRELMNGYNDKSGTLIENSITNELFKTNNQNGSKYGLGWIITEFKGAEIFFHSGLIQSFQTSMVVVPKLEKSIIVLINSYGESAEPLNFGILDILLNEKPRSPSQFVYYLIRSLPILVLILFIVSLFYLKKWKNKHCPMNITKRRWPNFFLIIGLIIGLGWVLYVPKILKASLGNVLDFDVSSGYSLILLSVLTMALSIIVYFNHNYKTSPNNVYKK